MFRFSLRFQTSTILFLALLAAACGAKDKNANTGSPKLDFVKDIAPIIKASCADADCHGKVSPKSVVYEDDEAAYRGSAKALVPTPKRLNLAPADPDYMPRGKALTADQKQKLLDFLNQ